MRRPAGGVGADAADREGGALRSQDVRRRAIRPALDGAILRVDPDTGAALPDNPAPAAPTPTRAGSSPTASATRSGSRFRPGHGRALGRRRRLERVGGDRPHRRPTADVRNYGWPCYEGNGRMGSYDSLNLNLCETLYAAGRRRGRRRRYYTYHHAAKVVPGEACPTGSSVDLRPRVLHRRQLPRRLPTARCSSRTTRAAASGSCPPGADGLPDPAHASDRSSTARAGPVDLEIGPGRRPLLRRPRRRHHPARRSLGANERADRARSTADAVERRRAARRSTSTARRRPTRTATR